MPAHSLGEFYEGFSSWRRMLAKAQSEDTPVVYANCIADIASYVRKGLDKVTAIDELVDMAASIGMTDADQVQAMLHERFADIEHLHEQVRRSSGNGPIDRDEDAEPDIDLNRDYEPKPEARGSANVVQLPARPSAAKLIAATVFNAARLNQMTFNPIKFVVPGYIAEGLTLFAGKPKLGKSWLLLHAAHAVAEGGLTLGNVQCEAGDVLYAALEDNQRRLQSRMTKLFGTQSWAARLYFTCEMPRLTEGGLDFIKRWIEGVKQPRLIIIDTLAMVRMPNRRDTSTYDADYAAVKDLRNLALEYGIAIVLVHHLRKAEADDPFDTISGTLGLTGAPDTIMILSRTSRGLKLHAKGRDIVEIEKAVSFDLGTCLWVVLGDAAAVLKSAERSAIVAVLEEAGSEALTPNQIASACSIKQPAARKMMTRLFKDGVVKKASYGKYVLTNLPPQLGD